MNILFFLYIVSFFSFSFSSNSKDINDIKKSSVKKVRKVDISILREDLINQLISILILVENTLNKLIKNSKKDFFIEKHKEVMDVFHWVNECIGKFNDDPTAYGRSEIEFYLNQTQKYKLFLNSI